MPLPIVFLNLISNKEEFPDRDQRNPKLLYLLIFNVMQVA